MAQNIPLKLLFKEQDLVVLKQLHILEDQENLPDNFVLFDCGSFSNEAIHEAILCFNVLVKNFHIIFIGEYDTSLLTLDKKCYTLLKNVPTKILRDVKNPSEHIATLIMAYIAKKARYTRKAHYCLSADSSFPLSTKIINMVGREFVYCCVFKSVKDFVDLQKSGYFSENDDDPTKMKLYRILQNSIPRDFDVNKGGKLMHFKPAEDYYSNVKLLWQELRKFGDKNSLHVNVTTAFPSVDYLVR